jgi:hypothetical protein
MPGPPLDVPPSELFLKLQEPRPSEIVAFPRRTRDGKPVGSVRIQVLPHKEHDVARKAALKSASTTLGLTKEETETQLGSSIVNDAVARELLAITCLTEEPIAGSEGETPRYARIFPDAKSIGETLSADELATLFNAYLLIQHKWGPFEKTVQTEDELSQWIKRLVEGAAEFPLQRLSSVHWAELASLLAARAYTLSAILESLHSSLPSTLQSRLGRYSMGTGLFGSRAASTSTDGSATSLKVADVEITIEDARDMALRMKDSEQGAIEALDAIEREQDGDEDSGY